MSERGIIEVEPKDWCEFCGKSKELRPYGPRGERICFNCGMKDQETANHQMRRLIYGESIN